MKYLEEVTEENEVEAKVSFVSEDVQGLQVCQACQKCIYDVEQCTEAMMVFCGGGSIGYWVERL